MTIVFQRKGTYGNLLIAFTWSNFVVNIIIYDTINDYCSVEKGCQYEIGSYYYQLMINIFSVLEDIKKKKRLLLLVNMDHMIRQKLYCLTAKWYQSKYRKCSNTMETQKKKKKKKIKNKKKKNILFLF